MPAKETQIAYGRRSQAANFEIFQLVLIKIRIESHNKIKSAKAKRGFCNLKKKRLQRTFRIRLAENKIVRFFFIFPAEFESEIYIAIAISTNRIVQTIGNTTFGGVIAGFTDSYQLPIVVKELPISDVTTTARTQ